MIFVFGSNLAGRHGRGAAKYAALKYGAERGVGEGPTGEAYAIPTKGYNLDVLPLRDVDKSIQKFLDYAKLHHDNMFLLTPIGTGLAGNDKRDIWKILAKYGVPSNVVLSSTWVSD